MSVTLPKIWAERLVEHVLMAKTNWNKRFLNNGIEGQRLGESPLTHQVRMLLNEYVPTADITKVWQTRDIANDTHHWAIEAIAKDRPGAKPVTIKLQGFPFPLEEAVQRLLLVGV